MNEFSYLPDTEQDQKEMLDTLEIGSIDKLFSDIPAEIRLTEELSIPQAMDESTLTKKMRRLAAKNATAHNYPLFLGAGTYDHYIPSVVDHVISRSEFYTAYTPYQAEASQGELQALFEFQTMVCELTGMDAANSSLYDGFTSLGEAATLAVRATKRAKILISKAVHPQGRQVLQTVANGHDYLVQEVDLKNDITDLTLLAEQIDHETAAVIIQYPNFLGSVEDLTAIKERAATHKALLIVMANPLALALLEAPGKLGADIVVGDMQPMGLAMNFGGPHCGYFAVKKKYMRKIPGRIVGQTTDTEGKRGFVLTLQAREQHIRREKATSYMSSNQALNALASSVFMSALGKEGIKKMAQLNIEKADYMARQLENKGFSVKNKAPFFNEFVVQLNRPIKDINQYLLQKNFIGGFDMEPDYGMENTMLIAVTEQRTKAEIDDFIDVLEEMYK
ncbi:aminomethyl-transferring glycine dehydrogenase subunit GcvPA [Carnobacterium pleistocenium]|uniref:aminomethyl-transferring glycine dehydrogenase subunit GcvPA n=1 Tax=Carnobacterium pleistocenium TaxID=181073 RepID=UPI00054D8918|nr:aminomethyl-transferring glycine dehydrogenase subunit GcvPA [Carnobacterium pleistocenium]